MKDEKEKSKKEGQQNDGREGEGREEKRGGKASREGRREKKMLNEGDA